MASTRVLAFALLTLPILSCTDAPTNASATAKKIGHSQLKSDAVAMLAQWKAVQPSDRSIPNTYWPDSIRQLEPIDVYPHMFGVLVVIEESDRHRTGIYIVTADDPDEETNPSSGSGVTYLKLTNGLHLAEVKVRQAVQKADETAQGLSDESPTEK